MTPESDTPAPESRDSYAEDRFLHSDLVDEATSNRLADEHDARYRELDMRDRRGPHWEGR